MHDVINLTDPVACEAAHAKLVAMTAQGLAPAAGSPLGNILKAASEMHLLYASAPGGPASVTALMSKAVMTAEGRDVDEARAIAEARNDQALAMQAKLDAVRAEGSHDGGAVERVSNPGEPNWLERANSARANPGAIISHAEKVSMEADSAADALHVLKAHYRVTHGLPIDVVGVPSPSDARPTVAVPRPGATTPPVRPGVAKSEPMKPIWAQDSKGERFDLAELIGDTIDTAIKARMAI